MKINISPVRRDETISVSVAGAVITINGEHFDFSRMADGDTLPANAIKSQWFAGQVDNIAGELEIILVMPLPANYSQEQAFPAPLVITADGPVALPQPLPIPEVELQELAAQAEAGTQDTQEPQV